MTALSELFLIEKGITAVIGSGGKTSLIRALSSELSKKGRVLLLTTTKIWPPDFCPVLTGATAKTLREAFLSARVVCAGEPTAAETPEGRKTKLKAPSAPICELAGEADYVLVEADGSRQLPLKAHLPFEPVIPEGTRSVIQVVGLSGIGKPAGESVHRPEQFLKLLCEGGYPGTEKGPGMTVTPEALARVLYEEIRGDILFLNGAETPELKTYAMRLAELVKDFGYRRAVCGSLKERTFTCLY